MRSSYDEVISAVVEFFHPGDPSTAAPMEKSVCTARETMLETFYLVDFHES